MAPEVFQGAEPSFASDLWSLGCIFYEMFSGTLWVLWFIYLFSKRSFSFLATVFWNGLLIDARLLFILIPSCIIRKVPLATTVSDFLHYHRYHHCHHFMPLPVQVLRTENPEVKTNTAWLEVRVFVIKTDRLPCDQCADTQTMLCAAFVARGRIYARRGCDVA